MELAQIRYFLAVCETRHFSRAAIACGISQPSLSVAIRQLEQELGGALFDRGPPVRLAPLGEAVKPHFKAILRKIEQVRRISAGVSDGARYSGRKTKDHFPERVSLDNGALVRGSPNNLRGH
jgi:LysR family transcriptional regulator, hydrogen peroxide-inducible genes activator